ncbi:MAG: hypothetical protein A2W72_01365 [Burkholderiales bacterium RIFCSPLOWO2_12_67_14]|nr:MAG: hypothetical protein A3I64_16890 [Burkholderiales bacterium RIFCSPLOWO2_02_FULL_67_64]OGB35691.1 MAG: hypothetical protein A3E51_13950 [Burkholderiales bacterium RIFCSPHIGHO2_12_FULL_67_38]OGB46598.1 MAG: hypothetical protein A2W72_01365 [Burkholderiales bacterium RIFCSPLOWO2_12_67_14]OGC01900.1 MAG: hypothetical protein A3G82_21855 [Burkholderiales bacterium RIFCSPLOWO2_12_FULL_67_210]
MITDDPDTMPDAEDTRWLETHADDVFLPSVRVQLAWRDVEAAVERGAIVPSEAHALWASWAMPGSPTRVVAPSTTPVPEPRPEPAELPLESTLISPMPRMVEAAAPVEPFQPVRDEGPGTARRLVTALGLVAVGAVLSALVLRTWS